MSHLVEPTGVSGEPSCQEKKLKLRLIAVVPAIALKVSVFLPYKYFGVPIERMLKQLEHAKSLIMCTKLVDMCTIKNDYQGLKI